MYVNMISSIITPMKSPSYSIAGRRGYFSIIALALFAFIITCPGTASAAWSKKTDNLNYRQRTLKEDHIQAGNIYARIKMYEKAVDQFERALEIDPQDKKVAAWLESAKRNMGLALEPVVSRGELKRQKQLEARRAKEAKIAAKKKAAEEAAAARAKAKEDAKQAKPAPQEEEKKPSEPVEPAEKDAAAEKAAEPIKPSAPQEPAADEPAAVAPAAPQVSTAEAPPAAEPAKEEAAPETGTDERTARPVPAKPGGAEPVVVNGDKVEYFHEQKRVVGVGNVSIEYSDVILTCDKVTVYLDTREAIAEGNVKVSQKGAFFTGDKMSYNFDTRQASVMDGYLSANPFYGRAKEVSKVANKDQFNMSNGYMTTCDLDNPHYRVRSKKVKIYLGDKVVAHHIFFYIGQVPVMYFPYYVQPLDQKKTHITVIPGERSEWGYFALTSFRYYLDDRNKGDVLLDYRSKNGVAGGINHYYTVPRMGTGALKIYYADDNGPAAFDPDKSRKERTRYRYQVRHDWEMGEGTDTNVTFELNKLSDPDVIKDYFYNEYEELGTLPDNYLSIITQKGEYSTEFLMRKSLNDFYNVVERLPEFRFDIPNLRLFDKYPLYYKLNSSAAYLNRTYADATYSPESKSLTKIASPQKDVGAVRVDAYNQISYAVRVFRALNLTPYIGAQETYYSRNRWGDTNLVRGIFKAGLDSSIKFYKIYDVTTNFMGLDINKLRHVITPTANYYYAHQPTIAPSNLNQFDEVDALTAQNGILLGLENRLQTKRLEKGQMKSVDLATLLITSDWAFRLNKDNTSFKQSKFRSVNFELDLIPYSWAYLVAKMTVNTKTSALETGSVDLVSSGEDKWNLSAGYRYEKVQTGLTNLATMDGMYKINEKWRIRAYERFNIVKGAFEEQEYTVSRDLHCWIGELTYNHKSTGDQSIWLVLKLKAFPDYPVGLKRTYSRPRFGSTNYQP